MVVVNMKTLILKQDHFDQVSSNPLRVYDKISCGKNKSFNNFRRRD